MSQALTAIERRIYNYLIDYLKQETYQPSIREIGDRFGIRSTKTVTEHLQSLQRKGYLDRVPSRSRALRIRGLNLSPDTYTIPLYANSGSDKREEKVETRFDLDRALACSADCYLVRAESDGARDLGIVRGDLILVDPSSAGREGELEVYRCEDEIEVRRSRAASARVSFQGAQPDGNGSAGVEVLGVARAVLRVMPRE